MFKSEKIILSLFLLLLSLPNVSKEDNDWLYERNTKIFCPSKKSICEANITYNHPYTPMIDGNFLNQAILNPYHYIYLLFDLQKNQAQKSFYLEAYYINKKETVISNGDCYLINFTGIYEYELRIYKPVSNSLIQIKFLGLNPQFFMKVNIKFSRDLSIYFYGVMLTYENSLNKSDIKELKDYNEKLQIIKQNERKAQAVQKANKILKKLFGKTLKSDFEYSENILTQIIPIPPFLLVTISIAVGYTDSTENYLEPEDDEQILSKFKSINGGIKLDTDNFEILGDNTEVDNLILKCIQLFNKKVNDVLLTIGLDEESFSLTISVSLLNHYVSLTFGFYDPITNKYYYEIQIKVELTNRYVLELVLATQEALSGALNKADEFDKKYGKDINLFIFGMILATIILSILILVAGFVTAAVGAVGTFVVVAINEIIQIVQTLDLELPILQAPQFIKIP